jgi:type I restriction enzyme, S subunit
MRLESKYLLYFCQTKAGQDLLQRVSPGGAGRNRTLNRHVFLQQEVPLPPPPEQRRLVARIEELAGQIREARDLRKQAVDEAEDLLVCMAHRRDMTDQAKQFAGWRKMALHECVRLNSAP